jgi:hypothetical protein
LPASPMIRPVWSRFALTAAAVSVCLASDALADDKQWNDHRSTTRQRRQFFARAEPTDAGADRPRAEPRNPAATSSHSGQRRPAAGLARATLAAVAGITGIEQEFRSNRPGGLGAYVLSAQALTVGACGQATALGQRGGVIAAADAQVLAARSSPGILYRDPEVGDVDIPFWSYDVDVGIRLGYWLAQARGVAVLSRLGYAYGAFAVDDIENRGRLSREHTTAVNAGVRLAWSGVQTAVELGLDTSIDAQLEQTVGLEDGPQSTMGRLLGALRIGRRIADVLAVTATTRLERTTIDWQGQSVRLEGVTAATRRDRRVQVLLAVDRVF